MASILEKAYMQIVPGGEKEEPVKTQVYKEITTHENTNYFTVGELDQKIENLQKQIDELKTKKAIVESLQWIAG